MTPLKDLSKFCRTLEMTLINCEVNLILTWYVNCLVTGTVANQVLTFTITDTKLYVPVVNLFAKLLEQLKSGFKRTINWNIYQSKITTQPQNQYLDYLIDPNFQGVDRLFVLSYGNIGHRTSY